MLNLLVLVPRPPLRTKAFSLAKKLRERRRVLCRMLKEPSQSPTASTAMAVDKVRYDTGLYGPKSLNAEQTTKKGLKVLAE